MKINKVKDYKNNKTYIRYKISLPKRVEESELIGKELTIKISKGRIVIKGK